jgi:hypothetical protein
VMTFLSADGAGDAALAHQTLDRAADHCRRPWPGSVADLVLADPLTQRLGRSDPQFGGDRLHRGPLGVVLGPHLGDHADRTFAQLKGVRGGGVP